METLNKNITWKIWVLAFGSFLFQSLTWIALHRALIVHPSVGTWIWTAVIAAIAITVTTFFLLVQRSRILANVLFLLSAAIYVLVSPLNIYVWIGGAIFCVFAIWYENRVWREARSRVDFALTPVISSSVSILLYGILLLLGFNIYYNVATDFRANPDKYYDRVAQQAVKSVPYFSKVLIGGVSLNDSFETLVTKQAQSDPEYAHANEFEKELIITQARQAFQDQFNITVNSNDQTIAEIMAEVAVNKIKEIVEPYQNYFPIVFAILITGLLATFAFLIRWLIIIISWLMFRVLVAAGFFRLEKIQVEVEKLTI